MNFKRRGEDITTISRSLKWVSGIVASVAIFAGAVLSFDQTYARAADVEQMRVEVTTNIQQARVEARYSVDQLRKMTLEDKVYELNLVPFAKRTDAQRALLDRYLRQMRELNERWVNPPPTEKLWLPAR